ncbi:MAG: cyclase family protein [Gammaproteobacteria bacterium]|nr:cyclase family protein [Gammaproteobacteria bacterium]MBQ0840752.1 cyclase family protein [Gammaproteobacteria bacterium]
MARFLSVFTLGLIVWAVSLPSQAEECKTSKWGAEDEIGSANLITPASVLKASSLIKQGKTQHLGVIIDKNTPAFGPRSLNLQIVQPGQEWGRSPFPNGFNYNDDVFQGWFGIGSQLDGLSHPGQHGMFYNCNDGKDFVRTEGVTKMGIEKVPPMVARGVVLDMAAHAGVDFLKGGQYFSVADVKAVEKKQGTPIREGDVVLFHTGWTENMMTQDPQTWGSEEPGISEEVAQYLVDKNVVAVGADTWGVDVVPPQNKDNIFGGHIILMVEHGIYLLETMQTGPLVRDKAFEFFFVLGPHRVRGTVQAMIDPIAIY